MTRRWATTRNTCNTKYILNTHNEYVLCFLDEPACIAVYGAITPVTAALAALEGIAYSLVELRVAVVEGGASIAGGDITCQLAHLSLGHRL